MTAPQADATFDSLYLARGMMTTYGGVTLTETHCMTYLACLLGLYRGRPVAEWGYAFVASSNTSPFADALLTAHDALLMSGTIERTAGDRYGATRQGMSMLERLRRMNRFQERVAFLDGALDAAQAMPLPSLSAAIRNEPQIVQSMALNVPRALLDEVGLSVMHQDFAAIQTQLGAQVDLVLPAVVSRLS